MKPQIKQWLTDFSGCNGGNIGSKDNPSIWVCGIEWGTGYTADSLRYNIYDEKWENNPNFGDGELDDSRFNQVVYKVLYALNGSDDLADYMDFAKQHHIFMQDSQSPYYKMNLYPISFPNTDHSHWTKEFSEITGFKDKDDYLNACEQHRFPMMKNWVQTYCPKLILCFGKSYADDFNLAFSDNQTKFFAIEINELTLQYKVNDNGTIIVVLPFPNMPTGLKSYDDCWAIGVFLRGLLK